MVVIQFEMFFQQTLATSLREKPIHDHTSSKFITNSSGHDEHEWKLSRNSFLSVSKADSGGRMLLVADESCLWSLYILYRGIIAL
jgi:hypothetical protein